jgi:hypothetical protein
VRVTQAFAQNAKAWAPGRYVNEFSFRFNNRKSADLFGMTVRRIPQAENLPYAKLIEENVFTPFVGPKQKGPASTGPFQFQISEASGDSMRILTRESICVQRG